MYDEEEGTVAEGNAREAVGEANFDARLRDLARLAAEVDRLEAEAKQLNAEKEQLSYDLAQYMLTTGCSKKVLDGVTYTQKQKVFSKVEDKEKLREWIFQNDAVDLLMAVHASKLTAYCNEQLENGGTTPEGVNPNFIKYSVSVKR
jgi:hypothetical protein